MYAQVMRQNILKSKADMGVKMQSGHMLLQRLYSSDYLLTFITGSFFLK